LIIAPARKIHHTGNAIDDFRFSMDDLKCRTGRYCRPIVGRAGLAIINSSLVIFEIDFLRATVFRGENRVV